MTEKAPPLRLALTVTEAAQSLGVSDDFFREHVADDLRWIRRGRKKLVAVVELERWVDRAFGEDARMKGRTLS